MSEKIFVKIETLRKDGTVGKYELTIEQRSERIKCTNGGIQYQNPITDELEPLHSVTNAAWILTIHEDPKIKYQHYLDGVIISEIPWRERIKKMAPATPVTPATSSAIHAIINTIDDNGDEFINELTKQEYVDYYSYNNDNKYVLFNASTGKQEIVSSSIGTAHKYAREVESGAPGTYFYKGVIYYSNDEWAGAVASDKNESTEKKAALPEKSSWAIPGLAIVGAIAASLVGNISKNKKANSVVDSQISVAEHIAG